MRITRFERPDPAGKLIDTSRPPTYLRTFVFDYSEGIERRVLVLTIQAITQIAASSRKLVRDRDFLIWTGEHTNSLGMHLYIVGVPYGVYMPVFEIFDEKYRTESSFMEITYSLPQEFQARPSFRYEYGKGVLYADPFDSPAQARAKFPEVGDFEVRSFRQASGPQKNPYTAPERPQYRSPTRHSEETWHRNREEIFKFLDSLKGPCGFRRLRSIIKECFGVAVYEEGAPEFPHYGLIRLATVSDEKPPAVRILINEHLPEKLKYIALAHEFGHYLLHFPLLLVLRYVDETAWSIPEIEPYCRRLLTEDPSTLRALEDSADEIASLFLIPAWTHPMARMTSIMIEGGVSPPPSEMIWRLLQPLFPEDRFADTTWNDLEEIRKRAHRDTNRLRFTTVDQAANLFERMFAAALRVDDVKLGEEPEIDPLRGVLGAMHAVATKIDSARESEARSFLQGLLKDRISEQHDPTEEEFLPGLVAFGRELVPPLSTRIIRLFPRIPLAPAIYNPDGTVDGDWRLKTRPDGPVGTLADWQRWKPDHGLALYRFESWQKKALSKL